jgi:hypothetical protein
MFIFAREQLDSREMAKEEQFYGIVKQYYH